MGRSWRSADIATFIAALATRLKPATTSILDLGVGDGGPGDRDETRLGLIEGRLGFYEGKMVAFHEVECLYCYGDRAVFAGFK